MKSTFFLVVAISFSFLAGCNSDDKKTNETTDVEIQDTVHEKSLSPLDDSVLYVQNKSLLWNINEESGFKLQKPKAPGIDTMSAQNVIQLLNNNYDSIYLDYVKISHDTIYVRIPDSERLTERIGSTGAEEYMASTTYSLTEIKGIKYVNYKFVEGDHASPGVYSRNNFKNFQ